jgi:hypothetical protein
MAPKGHAFAHKPQLSHFDSSILITLFFLFDSAPEAHASTQGGEVHCLQKTGSFLPGFGNF